MTVASGDCAPKSAASTSPGGIGFEPTSKLAEMAAKRAMTDATTTAATRAPRARALLDEPAFKDLPAVKAGHLYPLRGSTVFTFYGTNGMIDDLTAAAKAYAGS